MIFFYAFLCFLRDGVFGGGAAQVFARLRRAKTKLAYASYFQARNGGGRFAFGSCAARHRQAHFLIGGQGERLAYKKSRLSDRDPEKAVATVCFFGCKEQQRY